MTRSIRTRSYSINQVLTRLAQSISGLVQGLKVGLCSLIECTFSILAHPGLITCWNVERAGEGGEEVCRFYLEKGAD
jgi:hypothetical protein